ncbi:MAG TPA: cytochrome P450 [Myxococcota bacterium]|nr:cytochrome P450 [Myxococcota bacterium]
MAAVGHPSAPTRAAHARAASGGAEPPRLRGGLPLLGHLLEMRRAPIELFRRVHDECGEVGEFRLARQPVVLLSGEEAQEAFFRAPDEQLDQAAAYPFMTPIFGRGVVFDATPEQRKQSLRNSALRDKSMRGHADVIAAETERAIDRWGESGEVDLLDFFAELTIYTSSACLIGKEFREELTSELVPVFHDLEQGTDAFAYVNPYLPLPSFRRRDAARRRLVAILQRIFERREAAGSDAKDLFSVLRGLKKPDGSPRYPVDIITGMFVSMMFAGHHTTSTAASWTLIELLRHPQLVRSVVGELDELYADGREVSYQALREIPEFECVAKEALRLHPPLILLMRKVASDFHYKGWTIRAGKTVAVSPAVSNRLPQHFVEPERFDPDRYKAPRNEDERMFAWLPFGGGRHRCVGAPFAMIQLKAIFSVLLRRYEFELAQPPESYRADHSKMVVQLAQPCRVRYRRRAAARASEVAGSGARAAQAVAAAGGARVRVDRDLCQGHGVCVFEAPEVFRLDPATGRVALLAERPPAELYERVRKAVQYCPTHALAFDEE